MNNKIYIADSYLHYNLQNDLLIKNNNEPLVGIQLLDFYTYLETFLKNNNDTFNSVTLDDLLCKLTVINTVNPLTDQKENTLMYKFYSDKEAF